VKAPSEQQYLARDLDAELEIAKSDGNFLYDTHRKKYIDWVMGWCVGNLGWANPQLSKRIARFEGPDYVYPGYSYKGWAQLGQLLASIAPGKLTKCFRATGGSEAVEFALQAAMVHTGRKKFVSIEGSYHGNTIGAFSVASSEYRDQFSNLLPYCHKIPPPLDHKALEKIETRLKHRDVAAFIMEPISINLGVLIPEKEFMTQLQRLCRQYGTLLIMDEVATGFGRTGTLFATEHFDLEPDIMCMAKAITGGVSAMGATITTPAIARSMEEHGSFYSTYGWHPRSVDAAIATIRFIKLHKTKLLEAVATMSDYFRARLPLIKFKGTAKIRIEGLAIGVELRSSDYADRVQAKCRREGLLLSTEDATLLLLPALNVDEAIAKRGLDILERCAA
jgi:acetylornithine/succinyldiaminopimelate/putrescine aminotransferase